MRTMFILGCKTPWRLINPFGQHRLLCYVGLRRDTRLLSLDDHVRGTPLWVLAPLSPPRYVQTVPCYCR
jgi:hypothetical protein